jgi:hypothetical protein
MHAQEEALRKHLGDTLLTPEAFFKSPPDTMNGAAHSVPPKAGDKQAGGAHGHADGKQPPKDEGLSKKEQESAKARTLLGVALARVAPGRGGGEACSASLSCLCFVEDKGQQPCGRTGVKGHSVCSVGQTSLLLCVSD